MERRDFIKLTAITGTSAALTACGNPEHQLIRFVPDDDIVPGVAEWKPSVCPLCRAGCGLTVRVMDADYETVRNGQTGVVAIKAAKKLEGQPGHPVNRGGLCPRGQAAIQLTYHPDRLTQPLKRKGARGSGDYTPVSWDDAIAELVGRLDGLADRRALAFIARARASRRTDIAVEFVTRFGGPPPIAFEPLADDVLRRACAMSFGREQLPTFDIGRARYLIGFGADFLGTWNAPVANNAGYGEMRKGRLGVRGKFVQVETRMSPTGACADEWIVAKPGTEGVVALGLAHLLVAAKAGAVDAAALADYAPDAVEKITGVPAKRLARIAAELADMKPAVAVAGGPALAYTNGLFHAVAVNTLNAVLGSVGAPGGLFFTPGYDAPKTRPASADVMRSLAGAGVLLVDGADPVHGSPRAWGVRDAIGKVPFVASFGSFLDDTSVHADLILPDHSFLESWTDSLPESGSLAAVANAAGPVMRPLHQTRSTPDVLIEVAGKLKTPVALPWTSYEEALKASFDKLGATAWDDVAGKGGHWAAEPGAKAPAVPAPGRESSPVRARATAPPAYVAAQFDGDASAYPFHFLPFASAAFGDGSAAHLPWLQELPDPLTSAMWGSWVEINPRTAATLGVAQGDIVEVTSSQGSVRAPAVLSPGTAPDMVAMPIGQGHGTFTRYASGRGANPLAILAASADSETGALAWASTRVKVARVGAADGSLTAFAGETHENPHEHRTR
jgi:anaerobic selenocysteine-containing dehydrogenase